MRVAGAKSTAGRAVKCVDPSKTTRSESAWLGYPFYLFLYNEERRLGVQRGLDTLVVPFVTSNNGFSVVYNYYTIVIDKPFQRIFTIQT